MRRRDVQLSSWSVDPERDPVRSPPRPLSLRHEDYEEQFDFTTVFYDAFWDPAGDVVVLVGPPLFNMAQDLELVIAAWPSMARCTYAIRHLFLGCQIVTKPPVGTTGLIMRTSTSEGFIAPQPNLCQVFSGRRVAVTLSRNNELTWIRDWIEFNKIYHRCDGILIYDNNSDRYEIDDIYNHVEPVADGMQLSILSWPFKYGVSDWRLPLSYGLVDSLYCQPGMLEHARWRFLSHARSVLNTDVDELVITERHRSIFELVEHAPTGLLMFGGVWVENHPAAPAECARRPPRHRDFAWVGTTDRIGCEAKWAVVPARVPQAGQWHIHRVLGMPPSECRQDVGLRHFKAINTDWTVDRNRSQERRTATAAIDPRSLRLDVALQEALATVFSEDASVVPAPNGSPPPGSGGGRRAAAQGGHGAVEAAQTASPPMPDRRGVRLCLASRRERAKSDGAARALGAATVGALHRGDPWYHVQCGRWLHDEGDPVAAHSAFARAIELDPKFTVAYHDMARNQFHCGFRGRPAKADAILKTCAQLVPDDALTRVLLAKELERKGRPYDALAQIEVATALEPENPHFHCLHARILRRIGWLDAAEGAARRGIASDDLPARMQAFGQQPVVTVWREYQWRAPTAPELRAELAEILAAKGDRAAAEAAARSALAWARIDPERHHRLSEILAIRGRRDEATLALEAAIALAEQDLRRPTLRDWPLTQRNRHLEARARLLSRILDAAGRRDEAVAVLREALATVPDSGAINDQLAALLAEGGAAETAAALLKSAILSRPEDARLRYRFSKVLQATDLPEAVAQAEVAAELEPDTPLLQDHLVGLLLAADRTDDAARALAKALPRNARHAPLYFELSRLLQRRRRLDEALAAARRAVALEPRGLRWHDHLAALLIEAGRTDEAEASLRQAIERKIESGVLQFRLSRLLRRQRPEEALAAARRAVALEPERAYFCVHLIAVLIGSGEDAEAEAALCDALERHPGEPALHFHRSRLLQRRGRPVEAVAAGRRAVALEPQRARWHDHLAGLLMEAGRPDEAEVVLRQALGRRIESGGLYFRLSRLLRGTERREEALAAARRAVELEPQKPYLREHLVALLLDTGQDAEAEAVLCEALQHHPDHAALHFHHSRLLQRSRRLDGAVAAVRRAVELEPWRPRWRDRLAAMLVEAGRLAEAEAELREAIERNVESGGLYFRLSRLLQQQSPPEALAAARRAVALEPHKPYLRAHLIGLLIESGEAAEAETALRGALGRHPGEPALHFHQSRLCQRRGRPEEALAAARRAVQLEPQRPRWRDHLAALLAEAGRPAKAEVAPASGSGRPAVLHFPATRSVRNPDSSTSRAGAPPPSRRQDAGAAPPKSARRKRSLR